MKKPFFLAVVFVTGLASISVAQFSSDKDFASSNAITVTADHFNVQDTTKKPLRDTLPLKTDSLPVKKDSTSINF